MIIHFTEIEKKKLKQAHRVSLLHGQQIYMRKLFYKLCQAYDWLEYSYSEDRIGQDWNSGLVYNQLNSIF